MIKRSKQNSSKKVKEAQETKHYSKPKALPELCSQNQEMGFAF